MPALIPVAVPGRAAGLEASSWLLAAAAAGPGPAPGQVAAALAILAAAAGFDLFCLVDLARARYVRNLPRQAWALLILLSTPVGGFLYLMFGRDR